MESPIAVKVQKKSSVAVDSSAIESVLKYWFVDPKNPTTPDPNVWFGGGERADKEIKLKFGDLVDLISKDPEHVASDWESTIPGLVAKTVVLDQFRRNLYRNTPDMFALDHYALKLAIKSTKLYDKDPSSFARYFAFFAFMPLMHSEDIEMQEKSVEYFNKLSKQYDLEPNSFAVRHRDIVKQWGKFPHRDKILGRKSTPEEIEFLKDPKNSF